MAFSPTSSASLDRHRATVYETLVQHIRFLKPSPPGLSDHEARSLQIQPAVRIRIHRPQQAVPSPSPEKAAGSTVQLD